MRLSYLAYTISLAIMFFSIVFIAPVIVALVYGETSSVLPFVISGLGAYSFAWLLRLIFRGAANVKSLNDIKKAEALCCVPFCWLIAGAFGAIPFLFHGFSPINAMFESAAGITAAGATILTHYDYPHALMFWRSFSQWFGGMGIIILFIAILPQFAIAGRQMFYAEAPGPTEEKITPRIKNTASALWKIYFGYTILETILLKFAGMDWFTALCSSFSSVSGGGLSPNSSSFVGSSNLILWIVCFFMFCAGSSYMLQYKAITKFNPLTLFKNEEFRTYFTLAISIASLIALSLFFNSHFGIWDSITHAFFQVSSVISTTSFCSSDYGTWDYTSKALLLVVMLAGSCASSAGGGIKIIRWILIFKVLKAEFAKIIHPRAVYNIKINKFIVSKDVIYQILIFLLLYMAIVAVSGFVISILENNALTGLTSSISTLGNLGPTMTRLTGPLASYDSLHDLSKIILTFNMYVGRLEIVPFIVLFQKEIWQGLNK